MLNYKGLPCPVCNVRFNDGDDIVVCPECGAPYHRECYNSSGKCIFPDLHAVGASWEPAPAQSENSENADSTYEIKDQECPKCGALNAHSAVYCNYCGSVLNPSEDTETRNDTGSVPPQYNQNSFGGMYGVQFNPFDPMGGVDPAETMEEDITYGEASKLVQVNTRYYMQQFKRIKMLGKSRFNFCAFICSGPWMLYRKMYKKGIMMTSLLFIMYLTRILISNLYYMPVLESTLNKLGYSAENLSYSGLYSAMASSDFISAIANEPMMFAASLAMVLCTVGMFVIMLICGIKGNKMYMNHTAETIRQIKAESDNSMQYEEKIKIGGGTNTIVALVLLICYIVIQNITLFI